MGARCYEEGEDSPKGRRPRAVGGQERRPVVNISERNSFRGASRRRVRFEASNPSVRRLEGPSGVARPRRNAPQWSAAFAGPARPEGAGIVV